MHLKTLFFLLIAFAATLLLPAFGQDFEFGKIPISDLWMREYAPDTSASAVVLKEFGTASIKNGDGYELIYKHHVRIKILNMNGLSRANVEIPLYKHDNQKLERLLSIKASSFNAEDGRIHEEPISEKNVFTEERSRHSLIKKFAIPNVRVGSVIEMTYTIESPFIYNFREWEFQSDIPKVESEYWANIPGVYLYNITLRGFLKLSKNESDIVKNCLGSFDARGGASADCGVGQREPGYGPGPYPVLHAARDPLAGRGRGVRPLPPGA